MFFCTDFDLIMHISNMGGVMLEKLYGINTELGMSYCMDDEDFYKEVLEELL